MAKRKLPNTFGFRKRSPQELVDLQHESERVNRTIDAVQRVVPMDTPFHERRVLFEERTPSSGGEISEP